MREGGLGDSNEKIALPVTVPQAGLPLTDHLALGFLMLG